MTSHDGPDLSVRLHGSAEGYQAFPHEGRLMTMGRCAPAPILRHGFCFG
jgi:hypothetical protein